MIAREVSTKDPASSAELTLVGASEVYTNIW